MVVTVNTGFELGALKSIVEDAGLWLPLDSAHPGPLPLHRFLSEDLSLSWLSHRYYTARDWVMEMTVLDDHGEAVRCGAKVVKNVAGYQMAPLYIGARHSLGPIMEVTFRLLPLPSTLKKADWEAAQPELLIDLWRNSTQAGGGQHYHDPWEALRLHYDGSRWRLEGLTHSPEHDINGWGSNLDKVAPAGITPCDRPPRESMPITAPNRVAHCLPSRLPGILSKAKALDLPLVAYPAAGNVVWAAGNAAEDADLVEAVAEAGGWIRTLGTGERPERAPRQQGEEAEFMAEVKNILDPNGIFGPLEAL
jgi:FAD/FMN-containing dehydrogenase